MHYFLDSSSFPRRSSDGAADMPTLHRPYPLVGGSYPEQAHYRSEVCEHYHLEPHCVTCGGIHPGRVEPASCMELTTSWIVASQARRSCASSLVMLAQSFLHHGPESGLQVCLDRGCPRLQLAFSSLSSRLKWCGRACHLNYDLLKNRV